MALSRLIAGLAAAAFACTASVPGATQTPPAARAHAAVSTSDPAAQASFDRGLAMLYAFSVGEARLSFEKAAASDPHLAMARWGEALADTIDINLPQTADGDKRGALAIAEARRTEDGATPLERALIDALAQRYIARGTVARRFRWYSDAMNRVATSYPNDPNVLTLAAYAEWNALDNLVLDSGAPSEGGARMARELDRALELDPDNIGAHHLRIHVQEVLGHPDRALADARYFDGLSFDLGMSHLPHMAGHIYDRLGDYPALVAANRRAVANDDAYFALGSGAGQLYMRDYHNHDLEFILYGLTTQGLDAEASAALANESANEKLRLALRLHDNARVLALADASPATPAALRAIALARSGRTTEGAYGDCRRSRRARTGTVRRRRSLLSFRAQAPRRRPRRSEKFLVHSAGRGPRRRALGCRPHGGCRSGVSKRTRALSERSAVGIRSCRSAYGAGQGRGGRAGDHRA
jgi:hypothetical protein